MGMIDTSSFQVNGAFKGSTIYGTVEVTLGNETRRVRAMMHRSDDSASHLNGITAYGISGRYRTGMVAWPGSIEKRDSWANESVHFGFDSRSGKHHKATISFEEPA